MKAFVFKCSGRGVPRIMVIHAKCFAVAQREAVHRFERTWPRERFKGAWIDVSRADVEPAEKYYQI